MAPKNRSTALAAAAVVAAVASTPPASDSTPAGDLPDPATIAVHPETPAAPTDLRAYTGDPHAATRGGMAITMALTKADAIPVVAGERASIAERSFAILLDLLIQAVQDQQVASGNAQLAHGQDEAAWPAEVLADVERAREATRVRTAQALAAFRSAVAEGADLASFDHVAARNSAAIDRLIARGPREGNARVVLKYTTHLRRGDETVEIASGEHPADAFAEAELEQLAGMGVLALPERIAPEGDAGPAAE